MIRISGIIAKLKGLIKRGTNETLRGKLKPLYIPPTAPADLCDKWIELRCQNDRWLHHMNGNHTPCSHVFDVPKSVKFPQCPRCFWTYDYDLNKFGQELPYFNYHKPAELVEFFKASGLMR